MRMQLIAQPHKKKCHKNIEDIIGLYNEISYHVDFDSDAQCN